MAKGNFVNRISDDLVTRLKERLRHHSIHSLFQFEIEELSAGYCAMRLPYQDRISNGVRSRGTIHGGIVSTLADTAAAFALATLFDGHMSFATVDLHIAYLNRAQSDITAHARVIRQGSRINVVDIHIVDTEGNAVAKSTINFILTKPMTPS